MGASPHSDFLSAVIGCFADGVDFALVHESSIYGWGLDNAVMLPDIDVLLFNEESFSQLGCEQPGTLGEFATITVEGVSVRLWSRASLGLEGSFSVTSCPRYNCKSLAPELVLAKLPYSPAYPTLLEQRARLASIVHVDELSDEELALVAKYVRGN